MSSSRYAQRRIVASAAALPTTGRRGLRSTAAHHAHTSGHAITNIMMASPAASDIGSAGGDVCGKEFCDNADYCPEAARCIGQTQCALEPHESDFSDTLCPGASALQYYHIMFSCQHVDKLGGCLGRQLPSCKEHSFGDARSFAVCGEPGSGMPACSPEREAFELNSPPGRIYQSAVGKCSVLQYRELLPIVGNRAELLTNVQIYAPLLYCSGRQVGGASSPGSCGAPSAYFLFPNSGNWSNYRFSFNFMLLPESGMDLNSPVTGRIGMILRHQSPSEHYMWVWGGAGDPELKNCSGLYRQQQGVITQLNTTQSGGTTTEQAYQNRTGTDDKVQGGVRHGVWYFVQGYTWAVKSLDQLVVRTEIKIADFKTDGAAVEMHVGYDVLPVAGAISRGGAGFWFWKVDHVLVQDLRLMHEMPAGEVCDQGGVCQPVCGDGKCQPELLEDCVSCPLDCKGVCGCGDGLCANDIEVRGCKRDCGVDADIDEDWEELSPRACQQKFWNGITITRPAPRGFGLVAARWTFDSADDFLRDESGHGVDLAGFRGLDLSPYHASEGNCGTKLERAGDALRHGAEERGGRCLQTSKTRPVLAKDRNTLAGVLPIAACAYTVSFLARADRGTVGHVITWGDSRREFRVNRHEISIVTRDEECFKSGEPSGCRGGVLQVRWGLSFFQVPVSWEDDLVHSVIVSYNQDQSAHTVWIDGAKRHTEKAPCSGVGQTARAHLTFGEFTVGTYDGILDELNIYNVAFEDQRILAVALGADTSTQAPTPPPGSSGPVTKIDLMGADENDPVDGDGTGLYSSSSSAAACYEIATCKVCKASADKGCVWCAGTCIGSTCAGSGADSECAGVALRVSVPLLLLFAILALWL